MAGDVRRRGGVTRGTGCCAGGRVLGIAGGGVGGKRGRAGGGHRDVASHPRARRFDGSARTVVLWALPLKL
jgi:hypothetical protein